MWAMRFSLDLGPATVPNPIRALIVFALLFVVGCEGLDLDSSAPPRESTPRPLTMTWLVENTQARAMWWRLQAPSMDETWVFAPGERRAIRISCMDGEILRSWFYAGEGTAWTPARLASSCGEGAGHIEF